MVMGEVSHTDTEERERSIKGVLWQQVKLLNYLNLKINLALYYVQVGEGTLYAINGKRDLMKLNACTSLRHMLSYGGDEDLTFMISLGHD